VAAKGRPRSVPEARCLTHKTAKVVALGTRKTKNGSSRRYRCTPAVGTKHTFSVLLTDVGDAQPRVWTPPPACGLHEGSAVVRAGVYGTRTPKPRQMYRCRPVDGGKPHRFTPQLPRDHVHTSEGGCVHCEELRGFHHGETAVARTHSWPTRIVVLAMDELSRGGSYGETSRTALQRAELAAQRYDELVAEGMSSEDAADVVDAELAGESVPVQTAAADAESADGTPARYRRTRRSKAEVAAEKAAAAAEKAALAQRKSAKKVKELGEAARSAKLAEAEQAAAANPRRRNARRAEANNAWHVAADWVEAFSPVLYQPLHDRLHTQARAERARLDEQYRNGELLERPQVLVLDDVPVYGRDPETGKQRRDAGFFLLVAAEVVWTPRRHASDPFALEEVPAAADVPRYDRELRLRAVRAMPKSNSACWRLLLDELGYAPDFVVADAGSGIGKAVADHYQPSEPGSHTTFIPSLWHIGQAVQTGLADTRGALVRTEARASAARSLAPALADHVNLLSRGTIRDQSTWTTWWDDLTTLMRNLKLPTDKLKSRRRQYEQPFLDAIAHLTGLPDVPVSTGGLELLIDRQVSPMLKRRSAGFANIERTNNLFDLVVARQHGVFLDHSALVQQLRNDALSAAGYAVPLRDISDPRPKSGRYSSLRDSQALLDLADERGLR
jgi:hypothetical protein